MSDPQSSRLAFSVDLEEWYHSGRWVDGAQARGVPDTEALMHRLFGASLPPGDILCPTRGLLDLLDRENRRVTFFVLGEVARFYPDLVREIAARGHDLASHGFRHVDMTVLGPERFEADLLESVELLERLGGRRPVGYRAPNLVFEPWATPILERHGFLYDSTVCASRPLGGKYRGWADAPSHPYHPSYQAVGRPGSARLVELPLPAFPVIKLAAGSGIVMRIFDFHWTYLALLRALRRGDTGFYLHPWELGPRPRRTGSRIRNAIFLRHTGPWMRAKLERLLRRFGPRMVTAEDAAFRLLAKETASTTLVASPALGLVRSASGAWLPFLD